MTSMLHSHLTEGSSHTDHHDDDLLKLQQEQEQHKAISFTFTLLQESQLRPYWQGRELSCRLMVSV